jgi:hypothetical protein
LKQDDRAGEVIDLTIHAIRDRQTFNHWVGRIVGFMSRPGAMFISLRSMTRAIFFAPFFHFSPPAGPTAKAELAEEAC